MLANHLADYLHLSIIVNDKSLSSFLKNIKKQGYIAEGVVKALADCPENQEIRKSLIQGIFCGVKEICVIFFGGKTDNFS